MNLFLKSYRVWPIFLTLISWEPCFNSGLAQEQTFYSKPWIQEILLPPQYADIPNQSFYLDRLGHLFIGKENGLNIMVGNRSLHLHMNGPVYVVSVNGDSLFYAAENDIGQLVMDQDLGFHAVSMIDIVPAAYRTFVPSGLHYFADMLFMETDMGIYSLSGDRVEFTSFQTASARLLPGRSELFLSVEGKGTYFWSGKEFLELLSEKDTGGKPVSLVTRRDGILHVLTSGGRLFSLSEPGAYAEPLAYYPALEHATCLEQISNDLLMAAVPGDGISILDSGGRLVTILGRSSSLPDWNVIRIMACEDQDIWVLTPHSLHKITYPSPLQILELTGISGGRILTSIILDDNVLLGTSHGVYMASERDRYSDSWILTKLSPGRPESIHLLSSAGDQLFAAGSSSLYYIDGQRIEKLDQGSFSGLLAMGKDQLVASNQDGIIFYARQGLPGGIPDTWKVRDVDPALSSSHSFVEFEGEVYFLNAGGIYQLTPELPQVVPIPFHMEEQLSRFMKVGGELYLIGNSRVFRYERQEDTFLPLQQGPLAKLLTGSDGILEENGRFWIKQEDGKYRSKIFSTSDLHKPHSEYTSYPVLGLLGEVLEVHLRDSILYLTGKDRISVYDIRQVEQQKGSGSIRIEWLRSSDTGLLNLDLASSSGRFTEEGSLILSHTSNDVVLSLAGLEFQSVPEPLFRYRLPPSQTDWSAWQSEREVSLQNLGRGKHRFQAQSMDLNGRIYGPAELPLTIRPPVYGTWYAFTFYVLALLIGLFLFQKWRLLSYRRAETKRSQRMQSQLDTLAREKEKTDRLMAELMPEKTASDLKNTGKARWDKYERATVLFSDIQGFTRIAEEMNPEALIDELDKFFFHFDSVVEKYNIEKIKTIGDAYMAAGGIPKKNTTNPIEVVLAALEMQSYMQHLKSTRSVIWDLRIGIHTGPVIAGVVGHKKVSYDIWGDTVNTASRMESSGMPGKVNISGITYGMVKDYFICEYRGKLPVKYKGNIDMYFVNGLRPELSVDLKGIPNKRFFVNLQLLRLGDLEEKIFGEVLNTLPASLRFHRAEHARKVYNQAFLLCRSEEIEQEERLLVRTAALMLHTGLNQSYNNFENRSSVISREILPSFKYSETQIDQICNLILATKQPLNPRNRLEQVIIDARMEYIGRPDYITQCKLLYREMLEAGISITGTQFMQEQVELLSNFNFHTLAGQRLREVPARNQILLLEQEEWM